MCFFHIHYPKKWSHIETLHTFNESVVKKIAKQYYMESLSSGDDFVLLKREKERKYWVHPILRYS